jgi:hypothetical protein
MTQTLGFSLGARIGQTRQKTNITFSTNDPGFCKQFHYIGFWRGYVNQSLTATGTILPCYIGERVRKINPLKRKEFCYSRDFNNPKGHNMKTDNIIGYAIFSVLGASMAYTIFYCFFI